MLTPVHRRHTSSSVVAAAILIFGLLFVSNPTSPDHERAIYAEFSALHPLYEPLGIPSGAAARARYQSAAIFSFTTHQGRLFSVGALGQVWVRPKSLLGTPSPPEAGSLVVGHDGAAVE